MKRFGALLLVLAISLVSVRDAAAASVITSFQILEEVDTAYAIDDVPDKFVVKEIKTDTLGTQHELSWQNPKKIDENYKVEIYAAVEFQLYAPSDYGIESLANAARPITWDEIENAASSSWLSVDSPFAYVGNFLATDKTCSVDFETLLKSIEDYTVSDTTSSGSYSAFKNLTTLYLDVLSNLVSQGSVTVSDEFSTYTYVMNDDTCCRYFKFSKMKYFIRYVKAEEKSAYDEKDGQYHYYIQNDAFVRWLSKYGDLQSNLNNNYPSKPVLKFTTDIRFGIHDINETGKKYAEIINELTKQDERYFLLTSKVEFVSPCPVAFYVENDTYNNYSYGTDGNNLSLAERDDKGAVIRVEKFATVRTFLYGVDVNNGNPVKFGAEGNGIDYNKVVDLFYKYMYESEGLRLLFPGLPARKLTTEEMIGLLRTYGSFKTNIPFFSSSFETSMKEYLTDGELHGGQYVVEYDIKGPLMQNTVGFKAGGGLDSSTASSGVLDGDTDTNNGWLKKIYVRLGEMQQAMGGTGDLSGIEDKLDKLNKRLKKTNQWLAAIFVENTIADVLDNINKAVIGDAAESAGDLVDMAVTKFPFSIINDYKHICDMFVAEPKILYKELDLRPPSLAGKGKPMKIVVDFSLIDGFIGKIRAMVYIMFCLGLLPVTRSFTNFVKRQVDN